MSASTPTIAVRQPSVGAGFRPALRIIRKLFSFCPYSILISLALLSPLFAQAPAPRCDWHSFERMVRDGTLSDQEGEKAVAEWARRLEKEYPPGQFGSVLFFPLQGYSVKDVGGKNGDGYKPAGYRFLDGNRHLGHPAQDIFVRDRDQDGLGDLTGSPVDVLALADGVVLAAFTEWDQAGPFSEIRGGNYVWIYHPALKLLSYSAHLQKVFVVPGDKVQGGQPIATLGRSGTKASLPRSPTHLHFMLLFSATMEPVHAFPLLKSSIPSAR